MAGFQPRRVGYGVNDTGDIVRGIARRIKPQIVDWLRQMSRR
jgi:hypothetical protein